ncbi:MAG: sigma 54-interacting transcriptional regulator [Devosia sp.]|uniref:sigma-54 interaction domain-containing protein n=1 Tax=Devosia sp. TaxID=1871048 RepID=UPI0024C87869|nr:sigma 54-interacting transcriptional regulator [Devosia sp.]UYN99792.1 MAG: sigma 54-interacting transcriptional regulator [Devosia sp.]
MQEIPNLPKSVATVLDAFSSLGESFKGAITVNADARITWIDERYRQLLGIAPEAKIVGEPVEDIIPHSLLRRVVETGRPILIDIMAFDDKQFVVCRLPLRNEHGEIQGAVGFVFYEEIDYLAPILEKFETMQKQLTRAQAALSRERQTKYSLSSFVGASAPVRELKAIVRRFALRDGAALILGETGTGKELLAHAMHQQSDRADGPFVAVNVAAIPEALLEAEFFGVAPGAFTGADRRPRKGKFELAHGGTLFLDEIGDMPAALQAKLLRALQEGEFEPLGSNTVKKVDARIIAATSQPLEQRLEDKTFRADLYYRIAVLTIYVPPLRERLDDIGLIAESLLESIPRPRDQRGWVVTPDAVEQLTRHGWPGNVRELRNVLERAAAMAPSEVIDIELVRRALPRDAARMAPNQIAGDLADRLAATERAALVDALAAEDGSRSAAARRLGVSRSQFYEKLKRHQLE